jgi:hypothetical protein
MPSIAITTVLEARQSANGWLIDHLPDRFAAGIPWHDEKIGVWHIPVWLSYPQLEPLGPVGEIILDDVTGNVCEFTPIDKMKQQALVIYDQHRDEIEAALP